MPQSHGIETLRWREGRLELIDQRVLPARFEYVSYASAEEVAEGIRSMVVRGAPAIGCAAAYGVALDAQALREERGAGRTYDLVLVDPPYGTWPELQPRLAEALPAALAPDGMLVVETSARIEPELPLAVVTSRRYGSARITLFTR